MTEELDESFQLYFKRFRALGGKFTADTQSSETARIHKTQFAPRTQASDGMSMLKLFVPGPTDQHAPGHTQMHNPLRLIDRFVSRLRFPSARSQQVDHNVLAYPAHSADLRSFQRKHDLTGRRLQGLGL